MISANQHRARIGSFACSWPSIEGKIWARKHGGSRRSRDWRPGGCTSRIFLLMVMVGLLSYTTMMIALGQMSGPVSGGHITACTVYLMECDVIVTITIVFVVSIYMGNKAAHSYFGNVAGVYGPPDIEDAQGQQNNASENVESDQADKQGCEINQQQCENTKGRRDQAAEVLEAPSRDVRPKQPLDKDGKLEPRQLVRSQREAKVTHLDRSGMKEQIQSQHNEIAHPIDWTAYERVLRSQAITIVSQIDIMEFMDDLMSQSHITESVYVTVKSTRTPVRKVNKLLDHIFHTKNDSLLLYLLNHKEFPGFNNLQDIKDSKMQYMQETIWTSLKESLADFEVDTLADHMYANGFIEADVRDKIIHKKDKKQKLQLLVSSVKSKEAYSYFCEELVRLERSDLTEKIKQRDKEMDIATLPIRKLQSDSETRISHPTVAQIDNFIARRVLRKSSPKLLAGLLPSQVDGFVDVFYENEILDAEMRDDIHQETNRRNKTRRLITKLLYCGWKAYSQFKQQLVDSGSDHLKDHMENLEERLSEKGEEALITMMSDEPAYIRGYLEMFDSLKTWRWDLKKSGSRDHIVKMVEQCVDLFDLSVHELDEGSLVFSLTCGTVDGLLRFYEAYKSGELAKRFARQMENGPEEGYARIVIDKHSLITAFIILVNRDWPRESKATYEDSLNMISDTDDIIATLKRQLKTSTDNEEKLRESLKIYEDKETELLEETYRMYRMRGKQAGDTASMASENSDFLSLSDVSVAESTMTKDSGFSDQSVESLENQKSGDNKREQSGHQTSTEKEASTHLETPVETPAEKKTAEGAVTDIKQTKGFRRYLQKLGVKTSKKKPTVEITRESPTVEITRGSPTVEITRQSKGQISIHECSEDGSYILLDNVAYFYLSYDLLPVPGDLDGYELVQSTDDLTRVLHGWRLNVCFYSSTGKKVKLLAGQGEDVYNYDCRTDEQHDVGAKYTRTSRWSTADIVITRLLDRNGKEVARHTKRTVYK